jgi:hypothetical protein
VDGAIASGTAVSGVRFSIDITTYIIGNGTFSIALAPYLEVVWESEGRTPEGRDQCMKKAVEIFDGLLRKVCVRGAY